MAKQQQQQQQQQMVAAMIVPAPSAPETDSVEASTKRAFELVDQYDIDDPELSQIELDDELEQRKILEYIHKDYHEYQAKKRRFEKEKKDSSDDEEGESDDEESDDDDLEDVSKFELTKLLMSKMDSKQNDRYDIFRRTRINKTGIKKLTNQFFINPLPQDLIVIMSSISKMLLGEIIEKAKEVQAKYEKKRLVERMLLKKAIMKKKKQGTGNGNVNFEIKVENLDESPLKPEHIREAWRLYQLEHKHILPNDSYRKQGGTGDGMLFR